MLALIHGGGERRVPALGFPFDAMISRRPKRRSDGLEKERQMNGLID